MNVIPTWILSALIFLAVVVVGFWLSRAGRPYPGLVFNLHKLVALGGVAFTVFWMIKSDPLGTYPAQVIVLIALALLGILILFGTGALMSIQDELKTIPHRAHQAASIIVGSAVVLGFYLLMF